MNLIHLQVGVLIEFLILVTKKLEITEFIEHLEKNLEKAIKIYGYATR